MRLALARIPGVLKAAIAGAALLGALSLVVWRQSRALETLRALDTMRAERTLAEAELAELSRRIQRLESRAHVVQAARTRLGMHVPVGAEIVILPLAGMQSVDSQALTDSRRGGEAESGGAENDRRVMTHAGKAQ